ncbi:MAG: adenylate/guanylate cyclase domain-containing protein [Spirochaetales bacterium]|nr:adenylate/guanylate cyclase domain-containing protein [Spirochaetales bacterium]
MEPDFKQQNFRLAAVLYTDIYGFSRMMETNESATLTLLEYFASLTKEAVAQFSGNIIKYTGDGFLVDFNNTYNAVSCAIHIQKELDERNKGLVNGEKLLIRIGIHLGDIRFFEKDAIGEGINIASRLQALAAPGSICISEEVYNSVSNKVEANIVRLGQVNLKNITKPVIAYEISINEIDGILSPEKPAEQPPVQNAEPASAPRTGFMQDLRQKYPKTHFSIYNALESLSRNGVITKTKQEDGSIGYSIKTGKDLANFKNYFEKSEEVKKYNFFPTPYEAPIKIHPSILAALGVAGAALFFITQGMLFPILLVGVIIWRIRENKARKNLDFDPDNAKNLSHSVFFNIKNKPLSAKTENELFLKKAKVLRDNVIQELKKSKELKKEWGPELIPAMNNFLKQIENLTNQNREMDKVLTTIPVRQIEEEIKSLTGKLENTSDERMRREYERYLSEAKKHKHSYDQLLNQKELIRLRLNSAVTSLKQIQINLARLRSIGSTEDPAVTGMLKEKSSELSEYIDDLKSSYEKL